MPLTVGDKAPPFVLPASTGQHISLQTLAGKMVVLYFYPRDDTSGCTTEACGFRDSYDALKIEGQYGTTRWRRAEGAGDRTW